MRINLIIIAKWFLIEKNEGSRKSFPLFIQLFTHRCVQDITLIIPRMELFVSAWCWKGTSQSYKPFQAHHPWDCKHKQPTVVILKEKACYCLGYVFNLNYFVLWKLFMCITYLHYKYMKRLLSGLTD